MPAAAPPHKDIADDVPAAVRLEMTRLAVEGDERFSVSAAEIELGLRFTSDTLAELPARHPDRQLVFIGGSDTLLQFATWHEPGAILELARLVVAPRPGDDPPAIERGGAVGSGPGRRACPSVGHRHLLEHGPRAACAPAGRSATSCRPRSSASSAKQGALRGPRRIAHGRAPTCRTIAHGNAACRTELEAHCRGTSLQAERLARRWGASPDDAAIAGLLHDLCRELAREEVLRSGAKARTRDRSDRGGVRRCSCCTHASRPPRSPRPSFAAPIAEAIGRHTLGGPRMSVLDACLFVADATEPGRTWKGVDEVRRRGHGVARRRCAHAW